MYPIFLGLISNMWSGATEGLITAAVLLIVGWMATKWLKPVISKLSDTQLGNAQLIAKIADQATDYLVAQFPNASWDDLLDKVVDKIIDKSGLALDDETLKMAAAHAINKNPLAPNPPGTTVT